jgi:hypothetical protein
LVSQLGRAMTRVSDAQRRVSNELGLLKNGPATYEDWLGEIEGASSAVACPIPFAAPVTTAALFRSLPRLCSIPTCSEALEVPVFAEL